MEKFFQIENIGKVFFSITENAIEWILLWGKFTPFFKCFLSIFMLDKENSEFFFREMKIYKVCLLTKHLFLPCFMCFEEVEDDKVYFLYF